MHTVDEIDLKKKKKFVESIPVRNQKRGLTEIQKLPVIQNDQESEQRAIRYSAEVLSKCK